MFDFENAFNLFSCFEFRFVIFPLSLVCIFYSVLIIIFISVSPSITVTFAWFPYNYFAHLISFFKLYLFSAWTWKHMDLMQPTAVALESLNWIFSCWETRWQQPKKLSIMNEAARKRTEKSETEDGPGWVSHIIEHLTESRDRIGLVMFYKEQ